MDWRSSDRVSLFINHWSVYRSPVFWGWRPLFHFGSTVCGCLRTFYSVFTLPGIFWSRGFFPHFSDITVFDHFELQGSNKIPFLQRISVCGRGLHWSIHKLWNCCCVLCPVFCWQPHWSLVSRGFYSLILNLIFCRYSCSSRKIGNIRVKDSVCLSSIILNELMFLFTENNKTWWTGLIFFIYIK